MLHNVRYSHTTAQPPAIGFRHFPLYRQHERFQPSACAFSPAILSRQVLTRKQQALIAIRAYRLFIASQQHFLFSPYDFRRLGMRSYRAFKSQYRPLHYYISRFYVFAGRKRSPLKARTTFGQTAAIASLKLTI